MDAEDAALRSGERLRSMKLHVSFFPFEAGGFSIRQFFSESIYETVYVRRASAYIRVVFKTLAFFIGGPVFIRRKMAM